ncbi:MAG TPA: hypothetical protein DCX29_01665 [Hyphomonas sp.]|nr:hypothetical protein [Hyphomonas sp.]
MRSSDWQPMESAPLNPYGQPRGPVVLIWCAADPGPVACYYEPYGGPDNKPQWIVASDGTEIDQGDATHWMPIAAPWPEAKSDMIKAKEDR